MFLLSFRCPFIVSEHRVDFYACARTSILFREHKAIKSTICAGLLAADVIVIDTISTVYIHNVCIYYGVITF